MINNDYQEFGSPQKPQQQSTTRPSSSSNSTSPSNSQQIHASTTTAAMRPRGIPLSGGRAHLYHTNASGSTLLIPNQLATNPTNNIGGIQQQQQQIQRFPNNTGGSFEGGGGIPVSSGLGGGIMRNGGIGSAGGGGGQQQVFIVQQAAVAGDGGNYYQQNILRPPSQLQQSPSQQQPSPAIMASSQIPQLLHSNFRPPDSSQQQLKQQSDQKQQQQQRVGGGGQLISHTTNNSMSQQPCAPLQQQQQINLSTTSDGNPSQQSPATTSTSIGVNLMYKCLNFLQTLIKLSGKDKPEARQTVIGLVQKLISGSMDPESFTRGVQTELKSSAQPYLIPFLQKSLPSLRDAVARGDVSFDEIQAPLMTNPSASSSITIPNSNGDDKSNNNPLSTTFVTNSNNSVNNDSQQRSNHYVKTIGGSKDADQSTAVTMPNVNINNNSLDNNTFAIPKQTVPKIPGVYRVVSGQVSTPSPSPSSLSSSQQHQPSPSGYAPLSPPPPPSVTSAGIPSLSPMISSSHSSIFSSTENVHESFGGDEVKNGVKCVEPCSGSDAGDNLNDVVTMGGVNLIEERRIILATTSSADSMGNTGTGLENEAEEDLSRFFHIPSLRSRVLCRVSSKLESGTGSATKCPITRVARGADLMVALAVQQKLKDWVEQLNVVAEHRMENMRASQWYEQTTDVRGQLRWMEEVDRLEAERREERDKEMLRKMSRSKNSCVGGDEDQERLKAKAREMQQSEQEELRNRAANAAAQMALSSIRKRPWTSVNKNTDCADGKSTRNKGGTGKVVKDEGESSSVGDQAAEGSGIGLAARSVFPNTLRTPTILNRVKRVNMKDLQFVVMNDPQKGRWMPKLYHTFVSPPASILSSSVGMKVPASTVSDDKSADCESLSRPVNMPTLVSATVVSQSKTGNASYSN